MDVGTIDALGGYAGALATAVALYARRRGIKTHLARASLAAVGQIIQLPFMYDYSGRGPFDEPSGPQARGTGPLYRNYEAADGFFFLACKPSDLPALARELEFENLADDANLEQKLEQAFSREIVDAIVGRLRKIGIAAHRLENFKGVRERFMAVANGGNGSADTTLLFQRVEDHPCGHPVELIGRCAVRSARARITAPTPTQRPGTDTLAILVELGYPEHEIQAMLDRREIGEFWSEEYLPS